MILEKEVRTYEEKLPDLLAHEGKFVLIHDEEVVGFFDTYADAVQAGYHQFELKPFFVRQVRAVEQAEHVSISSCQA